MKKNVRLAMLLGAVVLVLGLALLIVLNLPETDHITETNNDSYDILLYDKTSLDAEEITVKNSSGEYMLVGLSYRQEASTLSQESSESQSSVTEDSDEESAAESSQNVRIDQETSGVNIYTSYTMQGYEDIELSKNMTDQLAYQCSYVTATKLIDKTGEKLAEYGLDHPVATVKTVFSDNSEETLYLGRTAPDNQGIYCKRESSKNVYLMQLDSVNMFLIKKLQLFDKTITQEYDSDSEDNFIAAFSVRGEGYNPPLEIDAYEDSIVNSRYKMRSPYREVCSQKIVQNIGIRIFGLSGSEIMAANVTDDDKKTYGLDKPYMDITSASADGRQAHILVSKADEDGNCFVMEAQGKLIFRLTKEDVEKWYNISYKEFLANALIIPNEDSIKSFTIQYGDRVQQYSYKHEWITTERLEEVLNTEITIDGEKLNSPNLSVFIKNLSGLVRQSSDIENVDGYQKIAAFTFVYNGEKEITDQLVLYRNKEGTAALTLNGNTECTVDWSYAEKLLSQIEKIRGKELIDIIETEEE